MDVSAVLVFLQLICEVFPISSSSHVVLFQNMLISDGAYDIFAVVPGFDHLLHLPTALVVALYFRRTWSPLLRGAIGLFAGTLLSRFQSQHHRHYALHLVWCAFVANVVTAPWYFVIKALLKQCVFLAHPLVMLTGLVVTAVCLFSLKVLPSRDPQPLTSCRAAAIGFVQGLALLPGISRLGITYVLARFLGLSPRRSMHTSFMIAFPTFVAGVLKALYDHGASTSWHLLFAPEIIVSICVGSIASYFALAVIFCIATRGALWKVSIYMLVPISTSLLLLVR